jgi:hypothetical protein
MAEAVFVCQPSAAARCFQEHEEEARQEESTALQVQLQHTLMGYSWAAVTIRSSRGAMKQGNRSCALCFSIGPYRYSIYSLFAGQRVKLLDSMRIAFVVR